MNKHKLAFFLCATWLIVEPLVMTSEIFVQYWNRYIGSSSPKESTSESKEVKQSSSFYPEKEEVASRRDASNIALKENKSTNSLIYGKVQFIVAKFNIIIRACFDYVYSDVNSLFQRTLGKRYHDKGFVRLENDSLVPCVKKVNNVQIVKFEENLKRFKAFLDQEGIEFLYIQRPSKNNKFDDQQNPMGTIGLTPEEYRADLLLKFCRIEGINYVDLREELLKTGNNWDDAFYKTDHHWKAETGFWAFQIIARILKEKYDFSFNEKIIQSSSYIWVPQYKNNRFLGSSGKKTGRYFNGSLDSVTKISPSFQTSYLVDILPETSDTILPANFSRLEGTFEEVCLFDTNIQNATTFNLHSYNTYGYYSNGDLSRRVINKLAPNNKKILFIRDSYACVLSPFLYGVSREFHEIDLRIYHQESLVDYCLRVKPDIVILMANYALSSQMCFDEISTLKYNAR